MRRIRVMLIAIAVVAIASGILAFKAKYGIRFCTTAAFAKVGGGFTCTDPNVQITRTCSILLPGVFTEQTPLPNYLPVCTTITVNNACPTNKSGAQCGLIFTIDED